MHSDLKPGNILMTREGRVKILDFGLAKTAISAQAAAGATQTLGITDPGTTVGTVDYMSPEQALVVGFGGSNIAPDWAPSGTHFLFSETGKIVDQDASGAGFSQRLIEKGTQPRWSPDGTRFAFLSGTKLMLANASGSNAVLLDDAAHGAPAWSPDGQWIAYRHGPGAQNKLMKIRATPGATPVMLEEGLPWAKSVTQWSPAGDSILYSAEDGLYLISPEGKARRRLTSRSFNAFNFAKDSSQVYGIFHNTGKGPEWQLYAVNMKTGAEKIVAAVDFPPGTETLAGFSIHPDCRRALTSIAKWPFQIWMLEGFDWQPQNWFTRLLPH